jgi:hypothetical protein
VLRRGAVTVFDVIYILQRQAHLRITVIDDAAVQHDELIAVQIRDRLLDLLGSAVPPSHPMAYVHPVNHGPIMA